VGLSRLRVKDLARRDLLTLVDALGGPEAAWQAPLSAFTQLGLPMHIGQALLSARAKINLESACEQIELHGLRFIIFGAPDYPPLLAQIEDPPPWLYVRGALPTGQAVAIVGTRTATSYGLEMTKRIVAGLAAFQVTIVSGLALGIDSASHKQAIIHHTKTVAVLPCGLDYTYPHENAALAALVVEHGALISEHPLGEKPTPAFFKPRNRIISGFSQVVVVVEAGEKSGALSTADLAGQQGRDVFAVPGSATSPASAGANKLIQDGAGVAVDASAILLAMGFQGPAWPVAAPTEALPPSAAPITKTPARQAKPPQEQPAPPHQAANPTEQAILEALGKGPLHADELARQCGLAIQEIISSLTLLELQGAVQQTHNMAYQLTPLV
jgi:DNA processing protein